MYIHTYIYINICIYVSLCIYVSHIYTHTYIISICRLPTLPTWYLHIPICIYIYIIHIYIYGYIYAFLIASPDLQIMLLFYKI